MQVNPGTQTVLRLTLSDGDATRFPRALVYNPAGGLDDTVDLTHVAGGLYSGAWTPPVGADGNYTALFTVYQDAGRTLLASQYERTQDALDVFSDAKILRALVHDNGVLDNQVFGHVFDGVKYLTSARLRGYDSKANADAAGATGLLYTFTISAVYVSGEQTSYKVTREGS